MSPNSHVPHDASNMHRTAKLFMDDGSAKSADAAIARLHGFGLTIAVDPKIVHSRARQIALFTLINMARRTFLGGVEVVGLPAAPSLVLYAGLELTEAVRSLGAIVTDSATAGFPVVAIGIDAPRLNAKPSWRLTWQGWNGGALPASYPRRLAEDEDVAIAPALAAAVGMAEVFSWHAGERLTAGRRAAGLSLWRPGADWLQPDGDAPPLKYLPSRIWMIGLGNLGQAFAWALACLPYPENGEVRLVLQDDDRMAASNDSTSILADLELVGERKARVVASWLEARGFDVVIEERRFGSWTKRTMDEPALAFCGVDNALARASLEDAGFGLVVEAGLGGGPQAFRSIALHTFPGSRRARDVWPLTDSEHLDVTAMPAYAALGDDGLDVCGLALLASRTVGVPFVGVTAACLALSEMLRRLHGSAGLELIAGSTTSLGDIEVVEGHVEPFAFGYVERAR